MGLRHRLRPISRVLPIWILCVIWLEVAITLPAGATDYTAWRAEHQKRVDNNEANRRTHLLINPRVELFLHPVSWNWGEMYFGQEYSTSLEVHNQCASGQFADVFIGKSLKSYLSAPKRFYVAPLEITDIPMTVTTPGKVPPPSDRVLRNGHDANGWHSIDHGELDYLQVVGLVEVTAEPGQKQCFGNETYYGVYGHIHQLPPPKILDACMQYWISGKLPDDVDCDEEFRKLASHYVSSLLAPTVELFPADWTWLPTLDDISAMSDDQLLAMKVRAESQRMGQ